jgi:dTDP-4-dehydrorhamnose reductase
VSRKNDGIDFADINTYSKYVKDYSTVVNCIAYCNTYDKSRGTHWDVNYKGVVDLVDYMRNMDQKLVHISTDYIYSNSESNASESDVPVHCENWYGYTKLLSDAYIQLKMPNYLLIRGTHKETPFEYDGAYINQIGNFDYVNEVAKIMVDLIEGEADGVYNVGTKLKTMYDLAKKTKPDVMPINEKFHYTMPSDVSMDLTKLRKFMGDDENSN